ncbi:MAG: NTP transferase domain-containing protein, partial [Deltaproteobacteria bacterium]|nr:NTP transferase domain-containing protein [Deltaproteobacteria bacterium]
MIQLLVAMSGQGTGFQKAGYHEPKPLISVSGVPMIERLLRNFPLEWEAIFVMAENHRLSALPGLLSRLRPNGKQLFIAPHKMGPSFAVLEALRANFLDTQRPVLVSYCDYAMVWDPAQFERFLGDTDCDAAVVSYRGFHAHYLDPRTYAYSRLEGERVVEVREKASFTENRENEYASSGGYFFKSGELLRRAIEYQASQGLSLNGELYTSLTVQALLKMQPQSHVRVFEIPGFFQWGTPEALKDYEYWARTFSAYNKSPGCAGVVDQLLVPMAGSGTRFRAVTSYPKPLVPVFGRPMF